MTLSEFINKYNGQQLDNGWGQYKGECVSLAWRFANECQNVPLGVLFCSQSGGAKDLYKAFDGQIPDYYDKLPPTTQRQEGDLVILDGYYGDVSVAVNGTEVFGQLGTPVFKPAGVRTQGNGLGLLRRKGAKMNTPNKGDLVNIHNEVGWPGHPINDADVAYWCNGTNNAHYPNPNDVWTALSIEVGHWTANNVKPADYELVGEQLYKKKG